MGLGRHSNILDYACQDVKGQGQIKTIQGGASRKL